MKIIQDFFANTVSKDPQIQAKINSSSPVEIVKIAAESGYKFTVEALTSYLQALSSPQDSELSDSQLEAVAGGMRCNITAAYSKSKTSAGVTVCCGDN